MDCSSTQNTEAQQASKTPTVKKSIVIEAPPSKVWQTLTDNEAFSRCLKAFVRPMHSEGTWEEGKEVFKIDPAGKILTRAIVLKNEVDKELKLRFYDWTVENSDKLCDYHETYLLKEQDGKTLLEASAGPLPDCAFNILDPMWDNFLPLVKQESEKRREVA